MNYSIRELKQDENKVLDTFLYEAIFIPEGVPAPSKDIINQPELQVYVKDFGENKGDLCLVAQVEDDIIGAVWVRIMNDYGHIDNETPSFAISLYKSLVDAGVQSIMVSHSALNGVKMHENTHYLTDVLRGELGFEGVIVSDWNSVQNITSTTDYKQQIITCVNAGVDWLMEPDTYEECAQYLVEAVEEGSISQERMDEAVTRIIRLKINAGLFDDPYLDNISTVQKETGSQEYRELAEQLVEKSQVLIKNEDSILPLKKGMKVFVTGPAANDSGVQCGGWTRTWTGSTDGNYGGEFIPGSTTILEGLEEVAEEYDITIVTDESEADSADVTILCLGEMPYAEWHGDAEDLSITGDFGLEENQKAIELADSLGKPIVTLIVAGRNVIIDEYKDRWSGIVMCGLPGSEGTGVANVLVGKAPFTGKLSMPWYANVNDIPNGDVWLEQGFGLEQ